MYKEITSALRRLSAPTPWSVVAVTLAFASLGACDDGEKARSQQASSSAHTKATSTKRTTIDASGNEDRVDPVIQSEPLTELVRLASQPASAPMNAPARLDASTLIDSGVSASSSGPVFSDVEIPFLVQRLTVTTGIENREPNEVDRFELDQGPIYAFVELSNPSEHPQEVVITFENPEGPAVGHVTLSVPAKQPRWRTWGRTRMIQNAGEWSAVVKTLDGDEIVRQSFSVEPSAKSLGKAKTLTPQKKEQPSS